MLFRSRVFAEECEILGGKKIKLCDCKGKKILVKAENGGPGGYKAYLNCGGTPESYAKLWGGFDIEIMCLDCGRIFEGCTKTKEGAIFASNLAAKKKKILRQQS